MKTKLEIMKNPIGAENPKVETSQRQPRKMRVLVVEKTGTEIRDLLSGWGYEVLFSENLKSALDLFKKAQPSVVLADLFEPELEGLGILRALKEEDLLRHTPFILLSGQNANVQMAVEAIKSGATDFLPRPLDVVRLKVLLEGIENRGRLEDEMALLRDKVRKLGTFGRLNGTTPKMKAIFKQIQVIAPTNASVLIVGENGTGKELVAKALHQNSQRKDKTYIVLNCSATPESLLEQELFGTEEGNLHRGCLELADGGTLFLDELADLSKDIQAKLLRFLETGSFRRKGGKEEIMADVRVISATNRHLEESVEDGSFREDLFYRLNLLTIKIPSLRERSEDIPLLIQTFIDEFNLKNDRKISGVAREAMSVLKKYSWPGNVRELKNVVERAVVVCGNQLIELGDLPETLTSKAVKEPVVEFRLGQTMEDVEKQFLFHTIAYVDGNKTRAAKMLDISLKTLHNKLAKYKSSI